VRNAAGFPGNQTVGLPTLVQNTLTANDIANPTGLDSWQKREKKREKK
jgi:hypothetical protein